MNVWTEHRNPEGRTYWFNTGTRESVWEKPDDLKTPFERALNQTKWKEYFSGGRKYYYNTETKESKWDMPNELMLLLEKVGKDEKPQNASALVPSRAPASATPETPVTAQADNALAVTESGGHHANSLPFAPSSVLPARPNLPDDPVIPHNGFATAEEGEKAFMHLLRKAGVDANWTWDQTMRTIITDPLYKALNTLAEKKACWQKYTDGLRAKEQEERDARLSKLRPAIRNMLKGNPNVFHYTTFTTADRLFAQHPIWQQAKIEAERKLVFEEYVSELKQREVQETRAARSRSLAKIVTLFKHLDVDVLTRWRQAHTMVVESDEWTNDPELQKLPTLDILLAFEDYSRVREREFEEQMRRQQVEKTRKERKAREAFRDLLKGLVDSGKIKARTKWKQVYPSFSEDERYLNMLGNPGSNPLELFWDLVDSLDQKLDAKIAIIETAIKKSNEARKVKVEEVEGQEVEQDQSFKFTPETTKEELLAILTADSDDAINNLNEADLNEIYQTMHEQAVKQQADEKRRAERRQRHLQDDLRYALKKLPEPLDLNLTFEDAIPLMESLPEYKAIEDEEGRRAAFAKFVKRQKERLREKEREASEDGGSTTSRKRKEPTKDERDRDRDRDTTRGDHRGDRDRDDRESRSTRHRHDDYESHGRRSSRDYTRERDREYPKDKDYYAKDKDRGEKDRDRDYYSRSSTSRHHRDYDRDDRRRGERRSTRDAGYEAGYARDWDEPPHVAYDASRERSASVYREDPREKRDRVYDDRLDERAEKRPRYEEEPQPEAERPKEPPVREETPEEGEI
ncbi:hypothetical protein C8Q75DRAFT_768185 [Abortiporus biennis]|nr:hypothetical protein C8Q75DRAFT_768185 [Abortiporus biennis]